MKGVGREQRTAAKGKHDERFHVESEGSESVVRLCEAVGACRVEVCCLFSWFWAFFLGLGFWDLGFGSWGLGVEVWRLGVPWLRERGS